MIEFQKLDLDMKDAKSRFHPFHPSIANRIKEKKFLMSFEEMVKRLRKTGQTVLQRKTATELFGSKEHLLTGFRG